MEDFVRWYSPRDWISCDDTSHDHSSHDHSSKVVEDNKNNDIVTNSNTASDPVDSHGDVVTNNNTRDSDSDVTNNSDNNVTNNSSGWDEDWAELEVEQPSSNTAVTSRVSTSHRVSMAVLSNNLTCLTGVLLAVAAVRVTTSNTMNHHQH